MAGSPATGDASLASLSADHETAVRRASEAVARVDSTQFLPLRSHANWTLALALHRAGHPGQAIQARRDRAGAGPGQGDLAFATSLDPFPPPGW